MNVKAKGNRQERRSKKLLESIGYIVTKSGGSLGAFDLIAINPQGMKLVQVKSNCWPGPVERETMLNLKSKLPSNAIIECWRWNDRARSPLVKTIDEF